MSLSVIIITLNAAETLPDCLASVRWADDIIVLDSGSTDATLAICQQFKVQVFHTDWPGFGIQKNRALQKAQGTWVLSIDADEQVSPQLRAAIQQAMQNPTYTAWRMPRQSWYCGRFLRHSGWYPDYVTRLFRRDGAVFSNDLVHERLLVQQGQVGTLPAALIHYSFLRFEQVLDKVNSYSSAGAQMLHQRGQQSSLTKAVLKACWAFIRSYVLRLGFLDGAQGFLQAVSGAEGTYYRYVKLWLLNMNHDQRHEQRCYLHRYPHVKQAGSEELLGFLGDISTQGMMLIAYQSLPPESHQHLVIQWPKNIDIKQPDFIVEVEIRWAKDYQEQEGLFCMGCRFVQLERKDFKRIDAIQTQLGVEPGFNPERFSS